MKLSALITRKALIIHSWIGLILGVFFLVMGASGSMLLFKDELEPLLNKQTHIVQPGAYHASLQSILGTVTKKYQHLVQVKVLHFPADRDDCYEFMLFKSKPNNTTSGLYSVFIDPYTGNIIAEGDYGNLSPFFLKWLYQFHYGFQSGTAGMLAVGSIGLLMLASIITGLVIYRRHLRDALNGKLLKRLYNKKSRLSSMHRLVGSWSLLFNLAIFFTGFWLNLGAFTPSGWQIKNEKPCALPGVPVDSILATASALPGFTPSAINIPLDASSSIKVRGSFTKANSLLGDGASFITFNRTDGRIEQVFDIGKGSFSAKFDGIAYTLHTGRFGGSTLKIIYMVFGLTPAILSLTGAWLWLRRKKSVLPNLKQ